MPVLLETRLQVVRQVEHWPQLHEVDEKCSELAKNIENESLPFLLGELAQPAR